MRRWPQREQPLRAGWARSSLQPRVNKYCDRGSEERVLLDHRLPLKRAPIAHVKFDLPQ